MLATKVFIYNPITDEEASTYALSFLSNKIVKITDIKNLESTNCL